MDLSIILLNYRQKGLLKQCLKGILAAQPRLDYELIVVDNDSGDGSLAMVNDFLEKSAATTLPPWASVQPLAVPPLVTIAAESNKGFGAGHNLGLSRARGKYILIVNPDIAVEAGALEAMFNYLERHAAIGILGPKLLNPDGTIQYSCRRFPNSLIPLYRRTVFGRLPFAKKAIDRYLMADFDHQAIAAIDWLFGACLMIRKSALEKVGNFDERFFMYFEDLDLCRRFWAAGYQVVFYPEVRLVHYHQRFSAERGGIWGVFSRGGRIHLISGIKYFLKYLGQELPARGLDN